MSKLRISPDLSLPAEAVTRSFGILGMRGSGKSNAAVVMAEEMFRTGLHWVAIDPKGDWWGIRSSTDTKGPGLPVVIFGGEHQDVPLEPTAAAGVLVADLILNEGITCVLDLSEFSKSHKIQFLAGIGQQEGFAGRLFRKKKREQDPLHVFLEEAHDYVPQKATGEVGKMIDVVSSLQTMGRTRGIGCSILSQRSARVHKDVLTQVDTLVAFRTISPQDRGAIEDWVKFHGVAREVVESLPTLRDGESWVWSPEWLGKLEKIRWRRRETYDSASTPVGAKSTRRPATLADVNLGAISEAMAATIERAKAEDPKELRRQLAELRKQLAARPVEKPEPEIVQRVVELQVPILTEDDRLMMKRLIEATGLLGEETRAFGARLGQVLTMQLDHPKRGPEIPARVRATRPAGRAPSRVGVGTPRPASSEQRGPSAAAPVSLEGITKPEQKILDSIAWWESVGFDQPTKLQVGFVAGYRVGKRVGGHYGNLLGGLRSRGLLDYPSDGVVSLTEAGRKVATPPDIPATTQGLQDAIFAKLSAPSRRILAVLVDCYPESLSKQELGERAGYSVGDRVGGHFGNLLGELRSLGLIDYPTQGSAAAEPVLFLE